MNNRNDTDDYVDARVLLLEHSPEYRAAISEGLGAVLAAAFIRNPARATYRWQRLSASNATDDWEQHRSAEGVA